MVPSGRSAMIWTVQPSSPEILHPHQPVADAGQHGLGDRGNAGRNSLLDDEAGLGIRLKSSIACVIRPVGCNACSFDRPGSTGRTGRFAVTKKSGSRGNPLSKADRITSDRYEISNSWTAGNIAICRIGARP